MQGLYHQIKQKRTAASYAAADAARPSKDPHISHELGLTVERLTKEAAELTAHARANDDLLEMIAKHIHYLKGSKHQSRYRSLVLTDLESACNWLMRENGSSTHYPEPI